MPPHQRRPSRPADHALDARNIRKLGRDTFAYAIWIRQVKRYLLPTACGVFATVIMTRFRQKLDQIAIKI
jgi:hypothetical protein